MTKKVEKALLVLYNLLKGQWEKLIKDDYKITFEEYLKFAMDFLAEHKTEVFVRETAVAI